jgi:hypothetical protein
LLVALDSKRVAEPPTTTSAMIKRALDLNIR